MRISDWSSDVLLFRSASERHDDPRQSRQTDAIAQKNDRQNKRERGAQLPCYGYGGRIVGHRQGEIERNIEDRARNRAQDEQCAHSPRLDPQPGKAKRHYQPLPEESSRKGGNQIERQRSEEQPYE